VPLALLAVGVPASYNFSTERQEGETIVPSYQSKALVEYEERYLDVARDLAHRVSEKVSAAQVKEYKGTFSILRTTTKETSAKIVLWDPENWKSGDALPFMREGVYIWVRANGELGEAIWGDTLPVEIPWIFRRMQKTISLQISPHYDVEFAYFPVMAGDDLDEIVEFLAACARV
jgi:hypothetical protein